MAYVRPVDFATIERTPSRVTQALLDRESGARTCSVNCIKTPVGDGSPAGLHTHPFDQIFYVLQGTMSVEIDGEQHQAGAGSLVVFPAGIAHRNWNAGAEPTLHLAFNVPLPDPAVPFASPAQPFANDAASRSGPSGHLKGA
jgi:quercetin dioxygenase-like cupin family protein